MTMPWLGIVAAFVVVLGTLLLGTALNFLKRYMKNIMSDDRRSSSSSSETRRPSNFTNEAHQASAPVIMDMASSSTCSPITTPSNFTGEARKLSESVFELHKPSGKPKLQIVFFHGFQLGGYENAHLSTWMSRDNSCVWPQTWLVEEFPHAHIFSVAYNARLTKSKAHGALDLYNIGENIVADLFEARIGQNPRCPLIVVGHSFGGIVIKQLCLHAREKGLLQHNNFLQNLKGVFFYSTPHHGAEFEKFAPRVIDRSPLLENVKILSTSAARLHHSFENLRKVHYKHWQVEAVGESQPTQWGPFPASIIVEEASSRYGENFGTVEDADHMTVCRPKDKMSRAFNSLTKLLKHISSDSEVFGPVHRCRGLPDHPSGLDQRVTKARSILENTFVLGIVGIGGIGKSTIAKQLFNDITIQFECTCYVDNVKGISIDMLDERVLTSFYQVGTKVEKGKMNWDFLMEKKTLIVMDDVDDQKQLMVLPKLKELGNGSRLVFTSRKHDVFSIYGKNAECYDVEFLEDDEARKLLFHHVFDADIIPNDLGLLPLGEYINAVVKKCGGLPLTLEVIGSYLRPHRHKVEFWEETTRKLGEAQPISGDTNDRVWASLMLSYSSLAQEEQKIFIDAATCFFEKPLEVALAAWSTPKGGVGTSWNNLIQRSLVKGVPRSRRVGEEDYGAVYMEIWVHEHLRDLAKKISGRQYSDLAKRISGRREKAFKKSVAGEVISLHVDGSGVQFWQRVTEGSSSSKPVRQLQLAEALRNLKYLRLGGDLPEWLSKPLPDNLSLLECYDVKMQRWLILSQFRMISQEGMGKLRVLRVRSGTGGMNFSNILGKLVNLRILCVSYLDGFTFLPKNFGNLSCLKSLELRGLNVSKLPDSFGDLRALEDLILEELNISELPESFGGLHSLKTLKIICSSLGELPVSFGLLKALKILTIGQAWELKALPDSFGFLCCLEELSLNECCELEGLPNSFGQLVGLKTLTITQADKPRELSEKFESLSAMTQLKLQDCQSLENLPLNFGLLRGLEELELDGCRNLQRLPDTFGQLTTLRKLTIRGPDQLQDLCDNFGLLRGLEELELDQCRELKRLPDTFGQLTTLRKLTIRRADHLQDLCDNFGLLRGLEELELDQCRELKRLPNTFGQLTTLRKLTIRRADHLQDLCDNFGLLRGLEELELIKCRELKRLPNTFGQLTMLKKLTIKCRELKRLPNTFGQLTMLKKLTIRRADHLQDLRDNFGLLRGLEELELIKCRELKRLPNTFGQLTMLKKLTIRRADHLQDLCCNFGLLSGLKELELGAGPDSYRPIQTLLHNSEKLSVLQKLTLTIRKAEHVVEFCDNAAGHLSAVKTVHLLLDGLLSKRLPDNFGRLTQITKLSIENCDCLEELPDSIGQISSLREIKLDHCEKLTSLPDSLGKPLSPQLALPRGDEASPSRTKAEDSDVVGKAVWRRVRCRRCRKKTIEGDRLISTKEEEHDLCSDCFEIALKENKVNEADFVRSCQPAEANSMALRILECRSLNHSVLTRLGWVRKPFRPDSYQRIRLDVDSLSHRLS